jgi:hypothetical protein
MRPDPLGALIPSREGRLIRHACAWSIGGSQRHPIRPDHRTDWSALIRWSQRHRVSPLVARWVEGTDTGAPAWVASIFQQVRGQTIRRNLRLALQLVRVMETLERSGIPTLAFKGPVLAVVAYGDLGMRQFNDLDLLIDRRQVRDAAAVLAGMGFIACSELEPLLTANRSVGSSLNHPCAHEISFQHADDGVCIDLHWQLHPHSLHLPPEPTTVIAAGRRLSLAGCAIRTLPDHEALLHLVVHAGRDGWACLNAMCDVASYLHTHPGLDLAQVLLLAQERRCQRMLRLGLVLAAGLVEIPPSRPELERITGDRRIRAFAADVGRKLFRREGARSPRDLPAPAWVFGLRDRPTDGLRHALLLVRLTLTRTAEGEVTGTSFPVLLYRLLSLLIACGMAIAPGVRRHAWPEVASRDGRCPHA